MFAMFAHDQAANGVWMEQMFAMFAHGHDRAARSNNLTMPSSPSLNSPAAAEQMQSTVNPQTTFRYLEE